MGWGLPGEGHRLCGAAFLTVNCNSFAAKLISESIGFVNIGWGAFWAKIYGFTDRGVAVFLEGGLHFDMPLRLYIGGAFEDFPDFYRDILEVLYSSCFCDFFFEFFAVKGGFFSNPFENGVYLEHFFAFEYLSYKDQRVKRFDAGGAVGEDANCPGWCDAGDGSVSDLSVFLCSPCALAPVWEWAPEICELTAGVVSMFVNELHKVFAELDPTFGIVWYAEHEEAVGKAHYAESDFSVCLCQADGLPDGEVAYVYDIVEKSHGEFYGFGQSGPVHISFLSGGSDEFCKVYASERAGLIWQEGLFTAGICGFDSSEGGRWVVLVYSVDECQSGLTGFVGAFDNHIPDVVYGVEFCGGFRGKHGFVS